MYVTTKQGGIKKMKKDYEQIISSYNGGDLDLSGCTIKNLELGNIEGNLNLSKCVIGKLSIGWVSRELNLSGADIKTFVTPIDADSVNMTGTKVKKLPSHIYTGSLTMEKSNVEKLNTDIRTNVFNIVGTKIEQLPKNFNVRTLIVDSKIAKNLPLTTMRQCEELIIDGYRYFGQNSVNNFNFCSVNQEVQECACV